MNKFKVMPMYEIEGIHFIVDAEKQALREFHNPANEISFIDQMKDLGTHYELRFDLQLQTVADDSVPEQQVKLIIVPQLTELDPVNMAKLYGLTVDQVKGKPDFEVIVNQEALTSRHNGKLPLIDIQGEVFVVDIRLHELRHAEYFFPIISLKSFDIAAGDGQYEGFYNTIMKQVVEVDPKMLEFPDHVIQIRLPLEVDLDPIAIARDWQLDERQLLRRYPIQKDLKAELIPLSETNLPTLIQRNKEALQQEHGENAKQIKPRQRPKF